MLEVRAADLRTVDLLVHAGVELSTWTLPAELFEAHHGPSITCDDVLDFRRQLEDDESFSQLLASLH